MSGTLYQGWIEEALVAVGLDRTQATIVADYDAPGYQRCLAVTFGNEPDARSFLVGLGKVSERTSGFNATVLALEAQTETVGLRTVLYFPGWRLRLS